MSEHLEVAQIAIVIFFIFIALTIGGLVSEITKKIMIPYPAAVFLVGILIGSQFNSIENHLLHRTVKAAFDIDANSNMALLLPALVFSSAFNADIYIMKQQIMQILMLSIPTLLISASLICLGLKLLLNYSDEYYSWGFAFVFGVVVTCTDTLQVVKLLSNAEAPKRFISLVQGESLINNCASMVLMLIAVNCASGDCDLLTVELSYGVSLLLGGAFVGVMFGLFTVWWIRRVNHNSILTINLTIVSAYVTYFVAESVDLGFKKNGLVAVISLGLFMSAFSKIRIRTEVEHPLQIFWQYTQFANETIIFIITGVTCGYRIFDQNSPYIRRQDYINTLLLYLYILLSKFISVLLLLPTINLYGQQVKMSEAILFSYSGTRGAVQLMLALLVVKEPSFSDQWSDIFLFHTTFIVILTMLINGSTIPLYIKFTGLCSTAQYRAKVRLNFLQEMKEQIEFKLIQMKEDHKYKNIDWNKVEYFSGLAETNTQIQQKDDKLSKKQLEEGNKHKREKESSIIGRFQKLLKSKGLQDNFNDDDIDADDIIETRDRFLMALKQTYWDLYSQNQCGGKAYNLLIESVRWDLDTVEGRMCSWDFIYNVFYSPIYMRFLYFLNKFPIIRRLSGDLLFDWVAIGYEVISTYVRAHEEMENMIEEFPINTILKKKLSKESKENRVNAENFIEGYFYVSFPEIIKLIQTKNSAQGCLASQGKYLLRKYELGELDFQQYQKLKLQLNNFVCNVEDIRPIWPQISIHSKLKVLPLFSEFNDDLLKQLALQSKELLFDKDECIFREGDLARYFYIITRGRVNETSSQSNTYTISKDISQLLSCHHIVLESTLYISQAVATSLVEVIQIEIELMVSLYKQSLYMQDFVWRDSIFSLSRFYPKELQIFSLVDREIIENILSFVVFKKYQAYTSVSFQAGILLQGRLTEMKQEKKFRMEEDQFDINGNEGLQGPLLFPFINQTYTYQTESVCSFFLFDETKKEEIIQLIQTERSSERRRTRLQTDLRFSASGVNKQSFGFSYLLRPSKANQDINDSKH
ncbi:unnamed protein product [Paramecium octaurelia]|uniref:Cyclic nucleotide-binding domain-containing protein n=1 Tax=Paramecium octaurelia TaxID=43137 RepID=A0A8S1VN11_PAROT|nr:unnamed protein product [Paramecium octaurelia]